MKNWLIIEPNLTGHHSIYLKNIVTIAHKNNCNLTIVTTSLKANEEHLQSINFYSNKTMEVITLPPPSGTNVFGNAFADFIREISYWKFFRSAYKFTTKIKSIDIIFLPFFDYCLYAIGLLGSPFGNKVFSGICMRPYFHHKEMSIIAPHGKSDHIKKFLFTRLISNEKLFHIFTIDESLYNFALNRNDTEWEKVKYLPDPADLEGHYTQLQSRNELKLPTNATIILVYGSLDERKGIDTLISAITSMTFPNNFHILLVGQQDKKIKSILQEDAAMTLKNQGKLHEINCFVDARTEALAFAATDAVWLGYKNHYTMSGVLVLAAKAKRPVIATSDGLIGWHVRTKALGATFANHNIKDVTLAIDSLFKENNITITTKCDIPTQEAFVANKWNTVEEVLKKEYLC